MIKEYTCLYVDGTLAALDEKWIANAGRVKCHHEVRKSPTRLGLHNMRDLFILIAIGCFVGAILSCVEVALGRRRERKLKSEQLARSYALKWRSHAATRQSTTFVDTQNNAVEESSTAICCFGGRKSKSIRRKQGVTGRRGNASFVPDLNFGVKPCFCYCSKCRVGFSSL